MAWLGNTQTLRGFDNFRFRDKSAMAASLEYRYRIWPAMDWGLFIDEGRVAPQLGDFDLHHFHTGYGFRLFVWPKPNLPLSIDVGRSNEKWRVYLGVNADF
jgi:outer membrane protein assembly factor BamA